MKWPLRLVRLIGFVDLVCAALLSLPVSLLIPAPWGLPQKNNEQAKKLKISASGKIDPPL